MSEDQSVPVDPALESESAFKVGPKFLSGTLSGVTTVHAKLTSIPAAYDTEATHEDLAAMSDKPRPDLRADFYLTGSNAEVVIQGADETSDDWQTLWTEVEVVLHEEGHTTQDFVGAVSRFLLAKLGERPA